MSASPSIDYLANHRVHVPTIAKWHRDEWLSLRPEASLQDWTERLESVCGMRQVPCAFVALIDSQPIGSSLLVNGSMTTHKHLRPWLAGVFVHPSFRARGIAEALINRAIAEAREIGVERLYLYTPNIESYYAKRGWSTIERTHYRDMQVAIMSMAIRPNQTPEHNDHVCHASC